MRKVLLRTFRISQDGRDPMNVSGFLHAVISVPIVRMHLGSFGDTIHYEPHQTLARSVGDMPQTNTANLLAIQFDSDRYQRFPDQLAASDTDFLPTHVSLIDFHGSRQCVAAYSDHGLPQLLQHEPCRLVRSETQFPLPVSYTHLTL